ncbi:MAG: tRNA (guanosine(37)-N1)-methyltransferase TrmD [Treponema sp.]|jgi:tRNA (guanine37-N1)-methyltransferase|nr:tRNA (guanosine(37)-N1)-methyltransferase TrmD [Treponema sp.]
MRFTVLSLFPEIIDVFFSSSIMAKAIERGLLEYRGVNIRDFAWDKHRTCDDAPYGGGPGMLMMAEPLGRALDSAGARRRNLLSGDLPPEPSPAEGESGPGTGQTRPRVICLSPSGRPFTQELAREFSREKELLLLCGRYEGIDQRIIDLYVDDEISLGDYVLSSGEAAALAVIDAVYRLVDRVITPASLEEESFAGGLLEYPQYTRPEVYDTLKVPEILLSGHHENIRRWRLKKRVEKTLAQRPDLIRRGKERGFFDEETRKFIEELEDGPETAAESEGEK